MSCLLYFLKPQDAKFSFSVNLLTSGEVSLGECSRVESINGSFSIETWKDCIAITSVFSKFTLFSRERLLFTLDSFEEITDASAISDEDISDISDISEDKFCSD